MRKLDGVIPILNADVFRSLKQQVLLFDRIYFVHVDEETLDAQQVAECKYLAENNILVDVTTVIDVEKLPQGMDEATQMLSLLALVILGVGHLALFR